MRLYVPPGKTTLVLVAVPLLRDRASIPREALRFPGVGLGVATKATWPEGVPVAPDPGATLVLKLMGVPCAMPLIEVTVFPFTVALKVVADGNEFTEDQLLTRFCPLTEPSPVAMS